MKHKTVKIDSAKLTLFILSNSKEINPHRKRPLILICPGGAYYFCSDREAEPIAIKFCSYGFNTAILNYTVNRHRDPTSPIYPLPQQELADAVAYIREHASELNTDPDMIITMGFSAGGHLVGSVGCMWKEFNNNSRPNAQVLCYPVISGGKYAHQHSFDYLCGTDQKLRDYLSLENRANKDTPPTFLWHTKNDGVVPYQNSVLFKEALDRIGIRNKFHLFENGCHGLSLATKEVCDSKFWGALDEISIWPEEVKNWIFELFGDNWY